ncbi:MAG: GNAT family N-acetyltransferase, partial [Acidobacteria bacterium]|nr:GNAT family N-acetyltransferase [Acidobacteriota bacterium]
MTISKQTYPSLNVTPLGSRKDLGRNPGRVDLLTFPDAKNARYLAGIANSERCIEEALRLRYEVFNVELGEGLESSALTGLDRDRFDDQMSHLVLLCRKTGRIVGTYRMQTVEHGLAKEGIYSSDEFDLAPLEPLFPKTVELGRACLSAEHRSFPAIFSMWLGIGAYMNLYGQHYLFGCCSLTTQDPDDGWRAMKTIRAKDHLHSEYFLQARPDFTCGRP